MESPEDQREIAVANSFVYFLITVSKLNLSNEVDHLLEWRRNNAQLEYFFVRNKRYVRELESPKGVLIL